MLQFHPAQAFLGSACLSARIVQCSLRILLFLQHCSQQRVLSEVSFDVVGCCGARELLKILMGSKSITETSSTLYISK